MDDQFLVGSRLWEDRLLPKRMVPFLMSWGDSPGWELIRARYVKSGGQAFPL